MKWKGSVRDKNRKPKQIEHFNHASLPLLRDQKSQITNELTKMVLQMKMLLQMRFWGIKLGTLGFKI